MHNFMKFYVYRSGVYIHSLRSYTTPNQVVATYGRYTVEILFFCHSKLFLQIFDLQTFDLVTFVQITQ